MGVTTGIKSHFISINSQQEPHREVCSARKTFFLSYKILVKNNSQSFYLLSNGYNNDGIL